MRSPTARPWSVRLGSGEDVRTRGDDLWRDRQRRFPELVTLARKVGFLSVHVYTNGTRTLTAPADFTWVSIDGPDEINLQLRGIEAEPSIANASAYSGRLGIVFTVNSVNYRAIEAFLGLIQARLPGRRVMFFFHTPYYGIDDLFLSPQQKSEAIRTILSCKRAGLPVLNSRAGLNAIQTGGYSHPSTLWRVVDSTGDYECCRAMGNPEVCRHCGYSTCAELMLARNFRLGPIRSLLHTW